MAKSGVELPYEYYPDPEQGRPVSNGNVYIGDQDTDPEVEGNRKPVELRQENGTLVPIAPNQQPLNTGEGGVVLYNGSPVDVLVEGTYSLKVTDSGGAQKYYSANVTGDASLTTANGVQKVDVINDLRQIVGGANDRYSLGGYNVLDDDGGLDEFYWLDTSTDPDDGGFTIQPTGHVGPGRHKRLSVSVRPEQFGAVADGVTDVTSAVQAAIDYARNIKGSRVDFQAKKYKVRSLVFRENVWLQGVAPLTDNTDTGSWLIGTSGYDVLTFEYNPTSAANNFRIDGLSIEGGENQIVNNDTTVWFFMSNSRLANPVNANVYTRGFIQQWFWNNVDLVGGKYGWQGVNLNGLNGNATNLFDKCAFRNVRSSGHSEDGMRIEVGLSTSVEWTSCVWNNNAKHGFYADGFLRGWTFINPGTERNHFGGAKVNTTGSITSGTNALTIASGTGIANGDSIVVRGAGADGVDLFSTVNSGGGTTNLVLADNASNTVTDLRVTNAEYDNFSFNNTVSSGAQITFINVQSSSGVGGDEIRYGINAEKVTLVTILNGSLSRGGVYDPNSVVYIFGADGELYLPLLKNRENYRTTSFPRQGKASTVASTEGGNLRFGLVDSNANASGTYGRLETIKFNSNRQVIWYLDGEDANLPMFLAGNRLLMGSTSNRGVFVGNGSPEGVVTAGNGAIYLRFDGGTGTTFWVKEAGTGNTGWVAK